jgi:arsenate reductase (thioredoxin)
MTTHVLILCTHNSARSVLAEAMLQHLAQRASVPVQAHSAGSAPRGQVHPLALQVLQAAGVATAGLRSKSWDEFVLPQAALQAPPLVAVITVCDSAAAEACPVFYGDAGNPPARVHWGYPDPSRTPGGETAQLQAFELTRQALGYRMLQLLQLPLHQLRGMPLQTALQALAST